MIKSTEKGSKIDTFNNIRALLPTKYDPGKSSTICYYRIHTSIIVKNGKLQLHYLIPGVFQKYVVCTK